MKYATDILANYQTGFGYKLTIMNAEWNSKKYEVCWLPVVSMGLKQVHNTQCHAKNATICFQKVDNAKSTCMAAQLRLIIETDQNGNKGNSNHTLGP